MFILKSENTSNGITNTNIILQYIKCPPHSNMQITSTDTSGIYVSVCGFANVRGLGVHTCKLVVCWCMGGLVVFTDVSECCCVD